MHLYAYACLPAWNNITCRYACMQTCEHFTFRQSSSNPLWKLEMKRKTKKQQKQLVSSAATVLQILRLFERQRMPVLCASDRLKKAATTLTRFKRLMCVPFSKHYYYYFYDLWCVPLTLHRMRMTCDASPKINVIVIAFLVGLAYSMCARKVKIITTPHDM